MSDMVIKKQVKPCIRAVTVSRQGVTELYITVVSCAGEKQPAIIKRINNLLKKQNAGIVKFNVFGPAKKYNEFMGCLENTYGEVGWPVAWIEGNCSSAGCIEAIQVHAVSGVKIETVFSGNRPVARIFEDDSAKYCMIDNMLPEGPCTSRKKQTLQAFKNMEKVLEGAGMNISNVVRTWFYNDKICSWYEEFNDARNSFLENRNISGGFLPASTGIGGKNPFRAAVIAGAIAVVSKNDKANVREILSPVQCPAPDYGSAFSRAVEITVPGCRKLLVSGTASIEADGKTVNASDIDSQIAFTMKAVEAILLSCGMSYPDVTRAIVYFKNKKDISAFGKYCKKNKIPAMPAVLTCSDICRDDLLFEIEVDAVVATDDYH